MDFKVIQSGAVIWTVQSLIKYIHFVYFNIRTILAYNECNIHLTVTLQDGTYNGKGMHNRPTELDQNSELRMFYLANNNSFDIDIKNEYLIGQETIIKGKYISANMTATYKSGSK